MTHYRGAKVALGIFFGSLIVLLLFSAYGQAQPALKKIRLALPTKTVSFLAFYVAHHKGFYKDEGIEDLWRN
jgi:ABC-type nitrate/sulfonate/bicarbonate transport system substrate-binding protein